MKRRQTENPSLAGVSSWEPWESVTFCAEAGAGAWALQRPPCPFGEHPTEPPWCEGPWGGCAVVSSGTGSSWCHCSPRAVGLLQQLASQQGGTWCWLPPVLVETGAMLCGEQRFAGFSFTNLLLLLRRLTWRSDPWFLLFLPGIITPGRIYPHPRKDRAVLLQL